MPLDLLSALTLLMARVDANHHDAAVTTDHAAVSQILFTLGLTFMVFLCLCTFTCNGT